VMVKNYVWVKGEKETFCLKKTKGDDLKGTSTKGQTRRTRSLATNERKGALGPRDKKGWPGKRRKNFGKGWEKRKGSSFRKSYLCFLGAGEDPILTGGRETIPSN